MPKTRTVTEDHRGISDQLECYPSYLAETERIERDRVSFDHFDRQHLKRWMTWMTDQRHYATKTVTLRLSAVKAFLSYSPTKTSLVALSQAAKALKAQLTPRVPIEYLTEPKRGRSCRVHRADGEIAPQPDVADLALRHRCTRG